MCRHSPSAARIGKTKKRIATSVVPILCAKLQDINKLTFGEFNPRVSGIHVTQCTSSYIHRGIVFSWLLATIEPATHTLKFIYRPYYHPWCLSYFFTEFLFFSCLLSHYTRLAFPFQTCILRRIYTAFLKLEFRWRCCCWCVLYCQGFISLQSFVYLYMKIARVFSKWQ